MNPLLLAYAVAVGVLLGPAWRYIRLRRLAKSFRTQLSLLSEVIDLHRHTQELRPEPKKTFRPRDVDEMVGAVVEHSFESYYNGTLFCLEALRDILAGMHLIVVAVKTGMGTEHLRYLAVSLAVHIHEYAERVKRSVFNKTFQGSVTILERAFLPSAEGRILSEIRQQLGTFNKEFAPLRARIEEIRNTVGAHRDANHRRTAKVLECIDPLMIAGAAEHVLKQSAALYKAIRELDSAMIHSVRPSGVPHG
jgi:hypothetical protein